MQIPEETREGAKMIVGYWSRVFCDRREYCQHDHGLAPGADRRTDMIRDLALIGQLRAAERDEFGPIITPATAPSSELAHGDERTHEEKTQYLNWLCRVQWEAHARWLGLEGCGGYRGEEGATREAPPSV